MSTPLLPVLQDLIQKRGPISVAEYMAICLGHPQHGYYQTYEPFGQDGDFITAPEISQLFGEMIAIWLITTWQQLGSPENVQLVELGPGRGTLMRDIWRGLGSLPQLRDALSIHLVEFSPRLQSIQQENLSGLPVTWHDTLETVPQQTSLIVANEFFDALPIEQAVYHSGHWRRRIVINEEEDLLFSLGPALQGIYIDRPQDGDIFEYAPMAADVMDKICQRLKTNRGAFLTCDYGDDMALNERIGETLQALFDKKPDDPLAHPGQADLTAHVSFAALRDMAHEHKLIASVTTQREFLTQHGIRLRAEKLMANATTEQSQTVQSGLQRLIDPAEMGDLFKVLQVISS